MKLCSAIFLFILYNLSAQQNTIETIYFEFDKFDLTPRQTEVVTCFIKDIDSSKVESIEIYGYCDDRGNDEYNFRLSNNRAKTIQKLLVSAGFNNQTKIIIIEGKGRVRIKADTVENLHETRSRNRRVDLIVVKKNNLGKGIYNSFSNKIKVGDKVFLENILFNLGSSKLTSIAKKELDKVVVILEKQKNMHFEIRGHVCCTPPIYSDGIDKDTKERKLSRNRAKTVFNYLSSKKISKNRMTYRGCGNKYPLGKGDALDRRVEFLITKL
ncbi:OmpA family protein [Flavobacterium aquidurense]|uniref:Outer membrane protein/peptidoglycan-associated (Lipo)protein n=1 Tax=Flavobacterium aquidurense TaxID=362413 RepID=A0A0Q0WA96_9FLAO|nr:OmpA family protein [Flavobacterium aquidurense]KQB41267.1 Outer membrane protein/peptidoglycan-associated (Lipo)protein [Flavobacterium aquidurense]